MFFFILVILLFKVTNTSSSSDLPTLTVDPMTEGQEASLTCTAPSLCSNPEFTWMWAESGGNISSISNNKTENQGPNSTLLFKTSAEHHGSEVTCQVTCSNQTSAEAKVTLNVTYVRRPEVIGNTTVSEGDSLHLTCSADSFPPSVITWTKDGINKTSTNETTPDTGKSVLVISNVTAKDAGQYFCTAKHQNNWTQSVNVTVIVQKKLEISGERAVLEGQPLSLTCSSNSSPPPLITWTRRGFNISLVNGTGAATLFVSNVTVERAGRYLCTAERLTLSEEVEVKVKYVRELKITGESTVKEGDLLNLTCTVDSFPPSLITWTKDGTNKTLTNETAASNLVIHNVTAEDAGRYFCTAKYQNTLMQDFNITVIYQRNLSVTGETSVTEGHVLNLTCTVDGWPSSSITLTKLGSNRTLKSVTGTATLVIYNVTTEEGGQYICTAKRLNETLNKQVNIIVKRKPEILTDSGCEARLDLLTCVCISQGRPLPSITWLLLENYTEYSFNTEVSRHTVKSTVSLTEKNPRRVSAVCVSSNENGKTERKLIVNQVDEEGQFMKLVRFGTQLGTMIPFLIGMLFSALILCLLMLCCRKKQKANGSPAETLEMVMVQETSLTNGGPGEEEYEPNGDQGTAGGAEGVEARRPDVEYSDIKLLMWGKKLSSGKKEENSFTEYAKIKPTKAQQKAAEEENGEEEVKLCPEEEAEGEEIAVYSNVTELMDQMEG